jgi:hypothetical protein
MIRRATASVTGMILISPVTDALPPSANFRTEPVDGPLPGIIEHPLVAQTATPNNASRDALNMSFIINPMTNGLRSSPLK